jgi:hypothetical protein
MLGLNDLLLGALLPLAAAAVAFALAWRFWRRDGAAWSAGLLAGYLAGAYGLSARNVGWGEAAKRIVYATQADEKLPLVVLIAAVPAIVAWLAGRRWIEWLLAAPLCVAVPLWLSGAKYRASQQLREAGFAAEDAITPTGAAGVLAAIAVGLFGSWWLWRRMDAPTLPKTRALLAIVALVGCAAAAGLTGSLHYAQTFGVLAAALGGCAATALLLGAKSGPESVPGPALLAVGGLLTLAAAYIDLLPWQAATLGVAFVAPVAGLPGVARLGPRTQAAIRTLLCVAPIALVLWQANAALAEQERQEQEQAAEPYFR